VSSFCAVFALLLMTSSTPLPDSVTNLDFEKGLDEKGRPAGWMGRKTEGYVLTVDPEVVHAGQMSARLERRENEKADKPDVSLTQWMPATDYRGKRVKLSGWLRTRDITSGYAALWMRVDAENTPSLAFDNMPERGPHGTTEWTQYSVVLDVAPEATDLYFGLLLAGNGTMWADDLTIEEVPTTVPSTALPKK